LGYKPPTKFYISSTKLYPTNPTGYPPYFDIMGETQFPEKISRQPIITRMWDFTWMVSDCEELVGR